MPKGWQSIGDAMERVVDRLRVGRGGDHGSALIPERDVLGEPATGQAHEIAAHLYCIEVRINVKPVLRCVTDRQRRTFLASSKELPNPDYVQRAVVGHFATARLDDMTPYAPSPCAATGDASRTCTPTHEGEGSPTPSDAGESDRPAGGDARVPVG